MRLNKRKLKIKQQSKNTLEKPEIKPPKVVKEVKEEKEEKPKKTKIVKNYITNNYVTPEEKPKEKVKKIITVQVPKFNFM